MSISVTTDVHCDGCGCHTQGPTGLVAASAEARRLARAKGWRRIRGRDLCPECSDSADQKVESTNLDIGTAIRARRIELELTQAELAGRAGRSRTTLVNIEKGNQGTPLELLTDIATALGTTPQALLDEASATKQESRYG